MRTGDTVSRTIRQHQLIPANSVIVVAVSGGVDSLALMHVLSTTQTTLLCRLHIATLDHGLRGEAGAEDARFVVETAQAWGMEATADRADVRKLAAEQKLGIEAAARQARYDFLAQVARSVGAQRIALAHHADDQAETVLMHLLRGAGTGGLAGMAYQAPHPYQPDLILIRPLLNVTRVELEAYCAEQDLKPRHDLTNEDTTYTRNRLRHEVLPYLETLFPQVKDSLVQFAEIAASDDELVKAQFEIRILPFVSKHDGRVKLDRSVFTGEHRALQRGFVRWAVAQFGTSDDLAYAHIVAAVEIMLHGSVGAVAKLPGRLQMRLDYDSIIVERDDAPPEVPEDTFLLHGEGEIPLSVPGVTSLGSGWKLHVAAALPAVVEAAGIPQAQLAVPANALWVVRTRRNGDRIAIGGGHSQKIKQWMSDHKIARALRDAIPLLIVNGEVAAVLWKDQWKIAEPFRLQNSKNVSSLSIWLEKSHE